MRDKQRFVSEHFDMSYEATKKGWSMPYSHHHTHYEIYILLSGERTVTIGKSTYHVGVGFASLFEGNCSHRSVGETDYSGICIHFSRSYLDTYFKSNIVSSYLACFKVPVFFIPEWYRQRLLDWIRQKSWNTASSYLLLAQILTDLNQFQRTYSAKSNAFLGETKSMGAARILQFIDSSYTDVQTVHEIAVSCGVSESYLHRIIKKNTSLTVKEYINHLRLRHAIHEIECTNYSFAAISKACGFENISYFYRLFKKAYGMTPTQYRRQHSASE